MKLVVQRVSSSSVRVDGREVARISKGLMVLFGAEKDDGEESAKYLAEKTVNLRIFPDDRGKMNLSCKDVGGEVLVVSQFTLAGDCSRGRRPGFENAAPPGAAERLYLKFVEEIRQAGLTAVCGLFGAHMLVDIQNDGPVTFILEG
ncbi:MAG: D-tyrosyl-tRNA(Tyr) deacylase [Nitrospinae bacterium]|nr:D-tyrosyl-tRNA(Tyr) deacylase [Nitrospinota bacterium]